MELAIFASLTLMIQYLFENYKLLEGKRFFVQDIFKNVKEYEKSLGYTETKTTQSLNLQLKQVFDFSFKSNSKRGYKFTNLEEKLKIFNPEKLEEYE